ncbi:MAG: restriction endonuclease [Prevotella sp.]|nr:restriction endonuclease [Prevotellaceae bacterium]MDY3936056.1 restriction endonuclease [Prevotella sp.]
MTPREFEHKVSDYYKQQGYKTIITPYSGDWGIDVIASRGKDKLAIQVKMYGGSSRKITRQQMMQLYGAMAYKDCTRAVMVTDGDYMPDAIDVAIKLGIEAIYLKDNSMQLLKKQNSKSAIENETTVKGLMAFDEMWEKYIMPLKGKTLKTKNRENKIVNVDWGGIVRITSKGNRGKIEIEDIKMAYSLLEKNGIVERSLINQFVKRCSSGIILLLSQVPFIGVKKNPTIQLYVKENYE